MVDKPPFLDFLWMVLTQTWLGVIPFVLFLLIALVAYKEKHHDRH